MLLDFCRLHLDSSQIRFYSPGSPLRVTPEPGVSALCACRKNYKQNREKQGRECAAEVIEIHVIT